MAAVKSHSRAGKREEENGALDRSLQQMISAIVDERNRLNIRQEISGLGEGYRGGGQQGLNGVYYYWGLIIGGRG